MVMVVPGFPPKSYYTRTCSNYNNQEGREVWREGARPAWSQGKCRHAHIKYPAIIIGKL